MQILAHRLPVTFTGHEASTSQRALLYERDHHIGAKQTDHTATLPRCRRGWQPMVRAAASMSIARSGSVAFVGLTSAAITSAAGTISRRRPSRFASTPG